MPVPVIDALHRVHPWLPILAVDAAIAVSFHPVGLRFVGPGWFRSRGRDGPLALAWLRSRLF